MSNKRQVDAVHVPTFRSKALAGLMQTIEAVAPKDVGLTFVGESGCGKEVLARHAHQLSGRCRGPFVPINCAAIPESLFESELFGHERGAFTGATQRVAGKIEAAEGGTLFLDEIGELPLFAQAKLLRFIENRRYMRVGGTTKMNANVRIMCATLRLLEEDVLSGRFRADLFYRIQGITLRVPPLRERRADINPLVKLFTQQIANKHRLSPPQITRDAKSLLVAHPWPGNVRELRNVIESLCLLRDGRRARIEDLPESVTRTARAMENHSLIISNSSDALTMSIDLRDGLEAINRQVMQRALTLNQHDAQKAAALLQVSPRTVQRRIASGAVQTSAADDVAMSKSKSKTEPLEENRAARRRRGSLKTEPLNS